MSENEREVFDDMFHKISYYLTKMKQTINNLPEPEHVDRAAEAEITEILRLIEGTLVDMGTTLRSYADDTNSTLQHVREILRERSSRGGRVKQTKRRKRNKRKQRKSIRRK